MTSAANRVASILGTKGCGLGYQGLRFRANSVDTMNPVSAQGETQNDVT